MAGASNGDGAALKVHDGIPAVWSAQASFDDACGDLDAAVMSLTEVDGETVIADAHLVALLLRVAAARRHLEDVTRETMSSLPASVR